jgi:hypothetical protein
MLSAMHLYKIEFLDRLKGRVVRWYFTEAKDLADAEANARVSFAVAQSDAGARYYQVRDRAGEVVAQGPGESSNA